MLINLIITSHLHNCYVKSIITFSQGTYVQIQRSISTTSYFVVCGFSSNILSDNFFIWLHKHLFTVNASCNTLIIPNHRKCPFGLIANFLKGFKGYLHNFTHMVISNMTKIWFLQPYKLDLYGIIECQKWFLALHSYR